MGEKAMNIVKKQKFALIYKKSIDTGTAVTLEHDNDFIYQQYLRTLEEPQLPLPTKVSNGVLALAGYTLSAG